MTELAWFLKLGSYRYWSGSGDRSIAALGGDLFYGGLEPGQFPNSVENPLTRISLELKPDDLSPFDDPESLTAEVAWGYGSAVLGGTATLLTARFYGRLERARVEVLTGTVFLELEHHLAFAYRAPRPVWSHEAQQSEHTGDEGLSQLPALARGDITGRWPPS